MKTVILVFSLAAVALATDLPGVGNFHQVNAQLYRGAQPTSEGFQNLASLGIRTVIDLREPGPRSDAEKGVVEKAGMRYVNIPFAGLSAPSDKQVAQVLALFDDPAAAPVFLHCLRGADRTGTVVACYRVVHDHWKNQDALAEAKANGMSWLEHGMQHYVLRFQPSAALAATSAIAAN